ncbi:sulfhydryl oxidase 2-like [Scaptodrosophila lebanonensis]|uniref:Sulfhydryl oxidase 2-like n=1 Tax=Drosophila lebanonensis TaxID=7225 RepID=A0A6J2T3E5_DROLE|nr:sulfhydryl oxidase 2-like [Scaptodrosophila lebanonensis]
MLRLITLAILLALSWAAERKDWGPYVTRNAYNFVEVLNATNFDDSIYGNLKASLVQFTDSSYASARKYAPVFRDLAKRLWDWDSVLQFVTVDCFKEINVALCIRFQVRRVPTLRFFEAYANRQENVGKDIGPLAPDEVREKLADLIAKHKYLPIGHFNLDPISNVMQLRTLLRSGQTTILVYQPQQSKLGRNIMLEFLRWPVQVRIVSDPLLAAKVGIDPVYYKVAVISRKGEVVNLNENSKRLKAALRKLNVKSEE